MNVDADSASDLAVARSRSLGYALLAQLLVRGLDAERLELIGDLPGLAEAVPVQPDLDELAAQHHALFHFDSTPYAAEFGDAADDVLASFRAGGFTPRLDDVRPDHLGVLIAHLSFLAGAQADALEDGNREAAARVGGLMTGFIDRHLVSWLPTYLASALDRPSSLWTAVLRMTWDVVVDHRTQLPDPPEPSDVGPALPPARLDLDDAKTGLKDVAEYLSAPARCGVFISREDITSVSRGADAPRGFGGRRLMVENLLRSASEYAQAGPVFHALRELVASRGAALLELGGGRAASSALSPWLERIDETMKILAKMETASSPSVQPTTPQ